MSIGKLQFKWKMASDDVKSATGSDPSSFKVLESSWLILSQWSKDVTQRKYHNCGFCVTAPLCGQNTPLPSDFITLWFYSLLFADSSRNTKL